MEFNTLAAEALAAAAEKLSDPRKYPKQPKQQPGAEGPVKAPRDKDGKITHWIKAPSSLQHFLKPSHSSRRPSATSSSPTLEATLASDGGKPSRGQSQSAEANPKAHRCKPHKF